MAGQSACDERTGVRSEKPRLKSKEYFPVGKDNLLNEERYIRRLAMEKRLDELCWKAFVKSGDAGTYLLYKALTKKDNGKEEQQ